MTDRATNPPTVDSRPSPAGPAPKRFGAPRKGDMDTIRRILDRVHVSTPDEDVRQMIRDRLDNFMQRTGSAPANGERTIAAWMRAAITQHRKNQALFSYVADPYGRKRNP